MSNPTDSSITSRYKNLLKGRETTGNALESLGSVESTASAEPDLSEPALNERLRDTKEELYEIIRNHLGARSDLYQIADKIVADGGEALRILRGEDDEELAQGDVIDSLEAIVRTDGSRPSFMIRYGEVDLTTSPAGNWASDVTVSMNLLQDALGCVGRIDVPSSSQGFEGTGFLIHENLIITNRHVLEVVADLQPDGSWKLKPNAAIDFGHEYRARESINRRPLRRVVFAGPDPINNAIDHKKLDLALLELEPATRATKPRMVLAIDGAVDWPQPQLPVYIVGYPGNKGLGLAPPTLLEQLFKSTYGHKRLAPGLLMNAQANVHTWTIAHDATTLGGNSGSVVLIVGHEQIAAGLHYGGRWSNPRENWGHVLGKVMEKADTSGKTLRQHLQDFDIQPVI